MVEKSTSNLYAYGYNELNNVYTVRGVSCDEISYEPVRLTHIPDGLLEKLKQEEFERTGNIIKIIDKNKMIFFSKNNFYAVVDFNNRIFTSDQVEAIFDGKKIALTLTCLHAPAVVNIKKAKANIKKLIKK